MINVTVISRTSGQPLAATIKEISKFREFFGLPCVNLLVMGSNLKGKCIRSAWYRRDEITTKDEEQQ